MKVFKYIKIKNFKPFKDEEFVFEDGITLVLGENLDDPSTSSNGSGKTSLFQALRYCLYKVTDGENDVSFEKKGDTELEVGFIDDELNQSYKVIRYYNHKDYENRVRLFVNDEEVSTHLKEATQSKINSILGISSEYFSSIVVLSEGMPISLSLMSPTIRKEYFEISTGFDKVWDTYLKKILDFISNADVELKLAAENYNKSKLSMTDISSSYEFALQLSKDKESKILELDTKIQNVMSRLNSLDKEISNLNFDRAKYVSLKEKERGISLSINNIKIKLQQYNDLVLQKLCPVCTQEYPKDKLQEAEHNIGLLSKDLDNTNLEKSTLISSIKDVEDIKIMCEKLNSDIDSMRNSYSQLKVQKNTLLTSQYDLEAMKNNLDSILDSTNEFYNVYTYYETKIQKLNSYKSLLLPSSVFRSLVLEKYLVMYNTFLEEASNATYPEMNIKFELDKKQKGVNLVMINKLKNREESYKDLSRGKKKRIDIICNLAFYRFLESLSSSSFNLIVFDEIFDGLDQIGIEIAINTIKDLWENKSIYIISHNSGLKSYLDKFIMVEYSGGESKILAKN